ncbi:MAG: hypothetical protein ABMB14_09130 [Myxococcota bacterium]
MWEINVDAGSSSYKRRRCRISWHGEEMDPESYEPNSGDDPNPTFREPDPPLRAVESPVGGCDDGGVPEEGDDTCANSADDDCDGAVDCDDGGCVGSTACCADADGVYARFRRGTPIDCDDRDPAVTGGVAEDCANGADDDCDGAPDCADSDCADAEGCGL